MLRTYTTAVASGVIRKRTSRMWIIFFMLVIVSWSINTVVVLKLKERYPKAYKDAGSPPLLWQGVAQQSFSLGFIGLGLYKEYELDANTLRWCNFYRYLNWLFLGVLGTFLFWWLLSLC